MKTTARFGRTVTTPTPLFFFRTQFPPIFGPPLTTAELLVRITITTFIEDLLIIGSLQSTFYTLGPLHCTPTLQGRFYYVRLMDDAGLDAPVILHDLFQEVNSQWEIHAHVRSPATHTDS